MQQVDKSQELTRTVPLALLKVGEDNVRNGSLQDIGEWRHIAVSPSSTSSCKTMSLMRHQGHKILNLFPSHWMETDPF